MIARRFHAEVTTAAGTAVLGLIAVAGATELGFRWGDHGPQSGFFPFYVGLVLILASLWNLGRAVAKHRATLVNDQRSAQIEDPFLDHEQLMRISRFLGALVVFVVVSVFFGIYVGSTLYIAWSAWRGGYRPLVALAFGLLFAVSLYLIFEVGFRVPLLKGPLEAQLGIY